MDRKAIEFLVFTFGEGFRHNKNAILKVITQCHVYHGLLQIMYGIKNQRKWAVTSRNRKVEFENTEKETMVNPITWWWEKYQTILSFRRIEHLFINCVQF